MERLELIEYEGKSVLLNYTKGEHPHSRTGIVYSVTMKSVVFWPLEGEEEIEISVLFEEIDDIEELKYVNLD